MIESWRKFRDLVFAFALCVGSLFVWSGSFLRNVRVGMKRVGMMMCDLKKLIECCLIVIGFLVGFLICNRVSVDACRSTL